jgi:hypothetical protein
MSEEINIHIHIDDTEVEETDKKVEELQSKAAKVTEDVEREANISFNKVMLMARGSYMMMAGLIRASGGAVSSIFRMTVSAAISTVAVLTPLLQAEAVTPGMQIQAAIGLTNLGLATAAIIAASTKQAELSHQLMGITTSLHGISMMLGSFYF